MCTSLRFEFIFTRLTLMISMIFFLFWSGCSEDTAIRIFMPRSVEKYLRELIDKPKGELSEDDFKHIKETRLDLVSDGPITNLKGIELCTELEKLDLFENCINDITPVMQLKKLTELNLGRNYIKDISPLVNLQNLEVLHLEENPIYDISPVTSMSNLKEISLNYGTVDSLEPLSKLKNLEVLGIFFDEYNKFNHKTRTELDLSFISELHNLSKLALDIYDETIDISPIEQLNHLKELLLFIATNHANLDSIAKLESLEKLTISAREFVLNFLILKISGF